MFIGQVHAGLLVPELLSWCGLEVVAAPVVAVAVGHEQHVPDVADGVAGGAGGHNYCTPVLVGTGHLESTNTGLPSVVDGAASGDSHWQRPVDHSHSQQLQQQLSGFGGT